MADGAESAVLQDGATSSTEVGESANSVASPPSLCPISLLSPQSPFPPGDARSPRPPSNSSGDSDSETFISAPEDFDAVGTAASPTTLEARLAYAVRIGEDPPSPSHVFGDRASPSVSFPPLSLPSAPQQIAPPSWRAQGARPKYRKSASPHSGAAASERRPQTAWTVSGGWTHPTTDDADCEESAGRETEGGEGEALFLAAGTRVKKSEGVLLLERKMEAHRSLDKRKSKGFVKPRKAQRYVEDSIESGDQNENRIREKRKLDPSRLAGRDPSKGYGRTRHGQHHNREKSTHRRGWAGGQGRYRHREERQHYHPPHHNHQLHRPPHRRVVAPKPRVGTSSESECEKAPARQEKPRQRTKRLPTQPIAYNSPPRPTRRGAAAPAYLEKGLSREELGCSAPSRRKQSLERASSSLMSLTLSNAQEVKDDTDSAEPVAAVASAATAKSPAECRKDVALSMVVHDLSRENPITVAKVNNLSKPFVIRKENISTPSPKDGHRRRTTEIFVSDAEDAGASDREEKINEFCDRFGLARISSGSDPGRAPSSRARRSSSTIEALLRQDRVSTAAAAAAAAAVDPQRRMRKNSTVEAPMLLRMGGGGSDVAAAAGKPVTSSVKSRLEDAKCLSSSSLFDVSEGRPLSIESPTVSDPFSDSTSSPPLVSPQDPVGGSSVLTSSVPPSSVPSSVLSNAGRSRSLDQFPSRHNRENLVPPQMAEVPLLVSDSSSDDMEKGHLADLFVDGGDDDKDDKIEEDDVEIGDRRDDASSVSRSSIKDDIRYIDDRSSDESWPDVANASSARAFSSHSHSCELSHGVCSHYAHRYFPTNNENGAGEDGNVDSESRAGRTSASSVEDNDAEMLDSSESEVDLDFLVSDLNSDLKAPKRELRRRKQTVQKSRRDRETAEGKSVARPQDESLWERMTTGPYAIRPSQVPACIPKPRPAAQAPHQRAVVPIGNVLTSIARRPMRWRNIEAELLEQQRRPTLSELDTEPFPPSEMLYMGLPSWIHSSSTSAAADVEARSSLMNVGTQLSDLWRESIRGVRPPSCPSLDSSDSEPERLDAFGEESQPPYLVSRRRMYDPFCTIDKRSSVREVSVDDVGFPDVYLRPSSDVGSSDRLGATRSASGSPGDSPRPRPPSPHPSLFSLASSRPSRLNSRSVFATPLHHTATSPLSPLMFSPRPSCSTHRAQSLSPTPGPMGSFESPPHSRMPVFPRALSSSPVSFSAFRCPRRRSPSHPPQRTHPWDQSAEEEETVSISIPVPSLYPISRPRIDADDDPGPDASVTWSTRGHDSRVGSPPRRLTFVPSSDAGEEERESSPPRFDSDDEDSEDSDDDDEDRDDDNYGNSDNHSLPGLIEDNDSDDFTDIYPIASRNIEAQTSAGRNLDYSMYPMLTSSPRLDHAGNGNAAGRARAGLLEQDQQMFRNSFRPLRRRGAIRIRGPYRPGRATSSFHSLPNTNSAVSSASAAPPSTGVNLSSIVDEYSILSRRWNVRANEPNARQEGNRPNILSRHQAGRDEMPCLAPNWMERAAARWRREDERGSFLTDSPNGEEALGAEQQSASLTDGERGAEATHPETNEADDDQWEDDEAEEEWAHCDCWHCVDRRGREAEELERASTRLNHGTGRTRRLDHSSIDSEFLEVPRPRDRAGNLRITPDGRRVRRLYNSRSRHGHGLGDPDWEMNDSEEDSDPMPELVEHAEDAGASRGATGGRFVDESADNPARGSLTALAARRRTRRTGLNALDPGEVSGYVNPFDLLMMRQSARRDVLEAMFQSVVRQLVLNNEADFMPLGGVERPPSPLRPEDIDRLETVSASDIAEPNEACPICLALYSDEASLTLLPCRHFFHSPCIREWLKKARTCPVCRHLLQSTRSDSFVPAREPTTAEDYGDVLYAADAVFDEDDEEEAAPPRRRPSPTRTSSPPNDRHFALEEWSLPESAEASPPSPQQSPYPLPLVEILPPPEEYYWVLDSPTQEDVEFDEGRRGDGNYADEDAGSAVAALEDDEDDSLRESRDFAASWHAVQSTETDLRSRLENLELGEESDIVDDDDDDNDELD